MVSGSNNVEHWGIWEKAPMLHTQHQMGNIKPKPVLVEIAKKVIAFCNFIALLVWHYRISFADYNQRITVSDFREF